MPSSPVLPPHRPRPYPLPVCVSPRITALAAAVAQADESAAAEAVAAFWAQVAAEGTPVVEPDGTDHVVTFLWRDESARAVVLHLNKLTDFHDLRQSTMHRLPGTDVWHLSYRMPGTWRGSYTIGPLDVPVSEFDPTGAPDRTLWQRLRSATVTDPLNRFPLADGPDGPVLSTVSLPDAPPQPWLAPRPGTPSGSVTVHRFDSAALGGTRTVRLWAPPGGGDADLGRYGDRPADLGQRDDLAVVVLLDGDLWGDQGALGSTLDNLVAAGRIPPTAVLMVDPVDLPTRTRDLACNPSFVDFLVDELLPWAGRRLPITADPARSVIAGQSLGGLTAAYAALRAPHRFGAVLSQSGSFWYPRDDWFATRAAGTAAARHIRWYIEVGTREWDLLDRTRRLRDVLHAADAPVDYHEYDGGHDPVCWRGGLADGLITLLGV
ncbi:hypothetical protein GCM10027290_68180 [Micromonospora sonneratiae]|uniref:Enterochelin esterase n=1 Tax=Micromonospora sonneratiae TaxID=1184706 RepID=A0ABW3YF65_9ACTN